MAFFGLTNLGADSCFNYMSLRHHNINSVHSENLIEAFKTVQETISSSNGDGIDVKQVIVPS